MPMTDQLQTSSARKIGGFFWLESYQLGIAGESTIC